MSGPATGDEAADVGDAAVLVLQVISEELDATLGPALLDRPDALHAHRKAVRRLRTALVVVRPYLDREQIEQLRDAYRGWGRALGEVRDLEVRIAVAERYGRNAPDVGADLPDQEDVDAAADALVEADRAAHHRAHRTLVHQGVSLEALERRRALAALLDDPPRTAKAARSTKKHLRRRLAREGDRVLRRADALGSDDPAALHDLRKAARRLRYAIGAVRNPPVGMFGDRARILEEAAERVQDLLGDHRDALAFADHVGGASHDHAPPSARRARADAAQQLAGLPDALDDLRTALRRFR
ncbi:CHAD domain-containing protein [Mumia flava]|uniref:CHAD domain-containing protein n=1 Tax=Mumia flava TaxID=1348852 RepID=A0A0B2B6R3_9ACTN|nr:CHAD domain-containing protein [Mumia flava]PJJ57776.1 CHAD domain-containing protein [Mumia flava]